MFGVKYPRYEMNCPKLSHRCEFELSMFVSPLPGAMLSFCAFGCLSGLWNSTSRGHMRKQSEAIFSQETTWACRTNFRSEANFARPQFGSNFVWGSIVVGIESKWEIMFRIGKHIFSCQCQIGSNISPWPVPDRGEVRFRFETQ